MSRESVCQVSRSWVDVGSFYTRLFRVVYFARLSPGISGYTLVFSENWSSTSPEVKIPRTETVRSSQSTADFKNE
jgi:hypothetical protein